MPPLAQVARAPNYSAVADRRLTLALVSLGAAPSPPQLFFDQLSCGQSDTATPDDHGIPEAVEDVREVLKQIGIYRYHLYGQSWGGILASEFLRGTAGISTTATSTITITITITAAADDDAAAAAAAAAATTTIHAQPGPSQRSVSGTRKTATRGCASRALSLARLAAYHRWRGS